jgi:hypothetical protein
LLLISTAQNSKQKKGQCQDVEEVEAEAILRVLDYCCNDLLKKLDWVPRVSRIFRILQDRNYFLTMNGIPQEDNSTNHKQLPHDPNNRKLRQLSI